MSPFASLSACSAFSFVHPVLSCTISMSPSVISVGAVIHCAVPVIWYDSSPIMVTFATFGFVMTNSFPSLWMTTFCAGMSSCVTPIFFIAVFKSRGFIPGIIVILRRCLLRRGGGRVR